MNVREAADEFFAAKRSVTTSKTMSGYVFYLTGFVTWCEEQGIRLEELRPAHTRQFIRYQQERGDQADNTIHHYAAVCRTFLRWCEKDEYCSDYIQKRIGDRVEMPRVEQTTVDVFTADEIKSMIAAAMRQTMHSLRSRDRAIIMLLVDTGIRAAEMCFDPTRANHEREPTGLRVGNVHLHPDDSYIKVYGKGRKEREIGLGRDARRALQEYLRVRGSNSEYVFLNRSGEPLTINGLDQLLKRLGETAGVQNVHAHKFRHTFACNYLIATGNVYMLSRLLGHTTTHMTERVYLKAISQRQARDAGVSVLDSITRNESNRASRSSR